MKRMRKLAALMICLIMSFSFTTTVMAKTDMTVEEAKEYLKTYSITQKNNLGKEYTTEFVFQSNEDLDGIAQYISVNGLEQFNKVVREEIAKKVSMETLNRDIYARSTNPSTGYAYVSGNGTHSVKKSAYGLASFDTLGTVEYRLELGYRPTVSNGKFTKISNISFDITSISGGGSWGKTSFPSYCGSDSCGVTANYVITKSVGIDVDGFEVEVKSETDNEVFALITKFR